MGPMDQYTPYIKRLDLSDDNAWIHQLESMIYIHWILPGLVYQIGSRQSYQFFVE